MIFVKAIHDWSQERLDRQRVKRFGGIQTCPWCRQTANQGPIWRFDAWSRDPSLDVLTCGVCEGTSLWRFEMGMIYIGELSPPVPIHIRAQFYDIEKAELREKATSSETPPRP